MASNLFKKGSLVRKCTTSGTPIGPWLKIVIANASTVLANSVDELVEDTILLDRKHVWKPKITRLAVSKDCIQHVLNGYMVISHKATPNWIKAFDQYPDGIVELYTIDGMTKIFCTVHNVYKRMSLRESTIQIIIDRIICK